MEPTEGSFGRLLGTDPRNPRANTNYQHMLNFTPNTFNQTQVPTQPPFNYSHQHSQPTHAMHNMNLYGGVGNLQHGMFAGAVGGASSHGSDSATPQSQIRETEQDEEKADSSGSSPNGGKRDARINYSEEDNLRLVSLWIKHSVDPIRGIDQRRETYWSKIAEAFNSGMPEGAQRRTRGQLKSHWVRINAVVTKFNGVYGRMAYCSGESEDMLMDKARATFKRENKKKPFTLEYVWKILRKEPKWYRNPSMDCSEKNKRTKVDESGAYTSSSNQDTDEAETFKEVRPEGQKKAKARMRGKGKAIPQSPLGSQPDEDMVLFHDAMLKRASALEKTAEASKEQVRMDKLKNYMQ
ncbi:hypothetical protein PVAP13_5NG143600 [Panicum virgatum]|uniref:No apical meristem-associated C-terminal domain-containing protein n=1 Tax=Panicum virgatum TaxID=38727 RepID=A0A8T0RQC2_PANVG|nr:hypothetical protein PVAP13_5NG143600 [Panicum virgatum]